MPNQKSQLQSFVEQIPKVLGLLSNNIRSTVKKESTPIRVYTCLILNSNYN